MFWHVGLPPGTTRAQRREVERVVTAALNKMTGDLSGKYYPLGGMSEVPPVSYHNSRCMNVLVRPVSSLHYSLLIGWMVGFMYAAQLMDLKNNSFARVLFFFLRTPFQTKMA